MDIFHFKQFSIRQDRCPMKVGTDGVLLGAWTETSGAETILDIGAGTGLISIMLAQKTMTATIDAVEIDEKAALQARENMNASPWATRLNIFPVSIQAFLQQGKGPYDLIVSNPPFYDRALLSDNPEKNRVRHTVTLNHRDLLEAVSTLLSSQGKFTLILPVAEGVRFREMASRYLLYCSRTTAVKTKSGKAPTRLLLQFERISIPLQAGELVIRQEGVNPWTQAYRDLTAPFYLAF